MPSAILAKSEEVRRKYNRTPFLRFQNGGTVVRSMGDWMSSVVWAALGAIFQVLLGWLPQDTDVLSKEDQGVIQLQCR
jgi:membrane protein required for beta-lactamase induction